MKTQLLLIVALLTAMPGLLRPDEKTEERLRAIGERMTQINATLEKLKNEKSSIVNEIYKIELQQELARIEFNKIETDLYAVKARIDAKNREKEELEKRIEQSRNNLKRILRVLYKSGEMGYIKFFIAVRNFDQLFQNYHLITILINTKLAQINDIRLAVEKLTRVRAELQTQLAAFDRLKNEQRRKLAQLHGLKNDKIGLITRINGEREYHMGVLEELKQEAQNLNKLLNESISSTPAAQINLPLLKGKIPWPITGKIVSTFGKKKNDRFETYIINNGIEIKPEKSDEIRAVLDGEVVYADYFSGYGNLIILQHKRNFHTLYAHCASFSKKKGDAVRQGETIATVGSTGATTQNTLYFEIRDNLKATDPLPWLAKR